MRTKAYTLISTLASAMLCINDSAYLHRDMERGADGYNENITDFILKANKEIVISVLNVALLRSTIIESIDLLNIITGKDWFFERSVAQRTDFANWFAHFQSLAHGAQRGMAVLQIAITKEFPCVKMFGGVVRHPVTHKWLVSPLFASIRGAISLYNALGCGSEFEMIPEDTDDNE